MSLPLFSPPLAFQLKPATRSDVARADSGRRRFYDGRPKLQKQCAGPAVARVAARR